MSFKELPLAGEIPERSRGTTDGRQINDGGPGIIHLTEQWERLGDAGRGRWVVEDQTSQDAFQDLSSEYACDEPIGRAATLMGASNSQAKHCIMHYL